MPQTVNMLAMFHLVVISTHPQGVTFIKISVTGDVWIDPSTVQLFHGIQNTTSISTRSRPSSTSSAREEARWRQLEEPAQMKREEGTYLDLFSNCGACCDTVPTTS